ncbi:hypothetical protein A1sIIB106_02295 [Candidatus Planktophila lacus]|uniref:Uncharacterized protein n=1 Tax=Candidatus Planktophila lacus TaxID=1884913 RepID=A0AAD0DYL8_9ACTN|nr:hypothetical protein A1s21148_02475 [Candidatus Planktophila lacus]ASY24877.1 hypothetical protein A1sIIB106_02295 [Candidatus Planktophila lacus]
MGNLWVGCDMGRESENPAIADGVFCCCSIMHLFDSENISLAGKQKVPQMILRDFFAVLWIERTPMTK